MNIPVFGRCPICNLLVELLYDQPSDTFLVPMHYAKDEYCFGSYELPNFFIADLGESTGKSLQGGPNDPVRPH